MKTSLICLIVVCANMVLGQVAELKLRVQDATDAVPYAKVILNKGTYFAITNESGEAVFQKIPFGTYDIEVKATNYQIYQSRLEIQDSISVANVQLIPISTELNTVTVTGTLREVTSAESPVRIEVITPQLFRTNPVSNIMEALQTVNGVQEQINCGVCGTNDIHINGMEGPYTLVLIDGMPIVSGLSSQYGFNGIPVSLIKQVEVIKGPSSTLYGTEAVGGIINIITKQPALSPLADVDVMANSHQEYRGNFSVAPKVGKQVFTSLSGDFYYNNWRMDYNGDNFTDIPLNKRVSIFNKWQWVDSSYKTIFSLAARYYYEDRFGGTLQWTPEFRGSDSVYGENILTSRMEVIGSYRFPQKTGLRFDFSANHHVQEAYYGDVSFNASQQVLFGNLIWNRDLGIRHNFLAGLTNRYVVYEDNTASATDQMSYVPGIFLQDEFRLNEKSTLLFGTRLDLHQQHGFILSPRFSFKHNFSDFSALRFNYGTGFRQVHLFTEDHAFVTGARDVLITETLKPEESHNITVSYSQTHTRLGSGTVDVDLFYTYFSNKIIPDYDVDPNLIVYQNLDGYGISRGLSVSVYQRFKFPLEMRFGATFQDVYEVAEDSLGNSYKDGQLFVPALSGTFSISYSLKKWNVVINYTGRVVGPQQLPEFNEPFTRPTTSPWYALQNIQVTKKFRFPLEIYCGVKNVLNYTQPSPLIDPANPFGQAFDTSYAYGPLQTRRFFLGLRYTIPRSKAPFKNG